MDMAWKLSLLNITKKTNVRPKMKSTPDCIYMNNYRQKNQCIKQLKKHWAFKNSVPL